MSLQSGLWRLGAIQIKLDKQGGVASVTSTLSYEFYDFGGK